MLKEYPAEQSPIEMVSKTDFPYERSGIIVRNDDLQEASISDQKGFIYRSIYDLKKTNIEKVEFKVLSNGVVIAVVYVKPVMINGHTFNFFTINNENLLYKMDIRLGDDIFVYADENMPPKVLFSCKNGAKKVIQFPKYCSKCKAPLKKVSHFGDDVFMCTSHLSCVNEAAAKIRSFTSAYGLYVPSLSMSIINDLIENALIATSVDLLTLSEKDYGVTQLMNKSDYERLLKEIQEAKKCTLERFICALSIPYVDISIAKELVYKFGNLNNIRRLNASSLSEFDSNVSKSVINYFSAEENQRIIDKLLDLGVVISEPKKEIFDICSKPSNKYTCEEYRKIVSIIDYNDEMYEVSDFEYDLIDKKAREIEELKPEWAMQRKDKFEKNEERWVDPIVELNKTYTLDKVEEFFDMYERDGCIVEPKVNGMACSLVYQDGILINSYTKRNKISSFNILTLLKVIDRIPKKLNTNLSGVVRGELYITDSNFRSLEREQRALASTLFNEPLTAIVSFFRGYSSADRVREFVDFFPFYVRFNESYGNAPKLENQIELHSYFKNIGFEPLVKKPFRLFFTKMAMIKYITDPEKRRKDFNVAIDGMVLKPYKLSQQEYKKNWCIGYKFQLEQLRSRITEIDFIKHKNGFVSAVLTVDPLLFSNGKKVTYVAIQNLSCLENIGINSTVSIGYMGGSVPKLESLDETTSHHDVVKVCIPSKCPECKKSLSKAKLGILRCENELCVGIASVSAILHFAEVMKISTPDIIRTLIDDGIIYDISAFYRILPEHLSGCFDNATINNFFSDVERSKKTTFVNFLYALSIPHVGKKTATDLANKIANAQELFSISEDELIYQGIYKNVARSLVKYMEDNKSLIWKVYTSLFNCDEKENVSTKGQGILDEINLDFFLNEFDQQNKTLNTIIMQALDSVRGSLLNHENLIENLRYFHVEKKEAQKKKHLEQQVRSSIKKEKKLIAQIGNLNGKSDGS